MRQGVIFSIIIMLGMSCFADTLVVDLSGAGDYLTIQSAINAADPSDGLDTIIVSPGTYYENINFGGKDIILTSTDPNYPNVVEATIINGGSSGSVITFSGDETSACLLSGFAVTGGDARDGGGIIGNGTKAAISCSIIQNNYAFRHGGGIDGVDGDINRCVISNNSTDSYGGGLSFCNGKITNCLISKNSSKYWGGGIEECNGFIGNCTIVSNLSGRSCGGVRDCKGVITNCIIWGNQHDELFRSSPPTYSCIEEGYDGEGNIDSNPFFVDSINDDYRLKNNSPCIDTGTGDWPEVFYSKDLDGKVRHLDGDNDGAFKSDMGAYEYGIVESPFIAVQPTKINFIVAQDAVDSPQDVLNIWNIGNGMLSWQISEDVSWLTASPVSGNSNGEKNEVILTADATGLSPGKYICTLLVTDDNAAVSPVEVEINLNVYLDQGNPRYVPSQYPTIQIGMDFANEGDMVIVNPGTYSENIYFRGRNITVTSTDPNDPIIVDSTVICGDGKGSVVTFAGSEGESCELAGFTITGGHTSFGGGINGNTTSSTISRCVIRDNIADFSGGGIYHCNGTINRSIITANSSNYTYFGGGGISGCNGKISNCLISYNSADEGGGVNFSNASIINCTIVNNTARLGGGLLYCNGKISNCIIWANIPSQLYNSPVDYSCIQGGFNGVGNINSIPCFVDPNSGDYYLLPESPCIDAGDPNYVPLPDETDLDGNARLVGSAVDMGCYEFVPPIEGIEVAAKLTPQSLNRKSKQPYIIGRLELAGMSEANIDPNEPMVLMPGDIVAERVDVLPGKHGDSITLVGFFDHAALIEAIDNPLPATRYSPLAGGELEVTITAKLLSGQWVYGTDTVKVK